MGYYTFYFTKEEDSHRLHVKQSGALSVFLSLTECMSASSCVSPSFLCFLIAILETATNDKMSLSRSDAQ